jgi:uncharacterized protein (TIGR00251 family)
MKTLPPTARLLLRIVPNAKRSEFVGRQGNALKVKIAAPALEGRANEELVKFLAEALGVGRRDVTLLRGEKSRDKFVQIVGLDEADAFERLGCSAGGL